jgi:hypothetical protein
VKSVEGDHPVKIFPIGQSPDLGDSEAEVVDALTGVLQQQTVTGQDELSLGVRDVTGTGLVCDHTVDYAGD